MAEPRPRWMRYYILGLCVLVSIVSYVDRQILSIMMEPIKRDLHLGDTQLGLLAGIFFSLFFIVAGVPLARLSDTGNRSVVVAVCLAGWSVATSACGLAQSFVQLAIARACVAVGEAGSTPAMVSLLADIFSPRARARVFSAVSMGGAIGIAFGIFLGGALSESLGWRNTFLVMGLPGVLLAVVFVLSIREPKRAADASQGTASLRTTVHALWRLRTFRAVLLVSAAGSAAGYAMMAWFPTFLIRAHGLPASQVGGLIGLSLVIGLITGNGLAGLLADALAPRGARWLMRVGGFGMAAAVPAGYLAITSESPVAIAIWFGLFVHFLGYLPPIALTCMVGVADPNSRAVATATIPIAQSIGGAVGPFIVGVVSDATVASHGTGSIAIGLQCALIGAALAALGCIVAHGWIEHDYRSEPGSPAVAQAAPLDAPSVGGQSR